MGNQPAAVAAGSLEGAVAAAELADAVAATPPVAEALSSEAPPPDLDDVAESAFRAEARDRGEVVRPAAATAEVAEETNAKTLPPLNDLVSRIPPEVRETLDDLFRAKFITVKRVPKSALKS